MTVGNSLGLEPLTRQIRPNLELAGHHDGDGDVFYGDFFTIFQWYVQMRFDHDDDGDVWRWWFLDALASLKPHCEVSFTTFSDC